MSYVVPKLVLVTGISQHELLGQFQVGRNDALEKGIQICSK